MGENVQFGVFLGRESEQGVELLYFGGKNMLKEAAF